MKPYFETELGKLYHGDCLEIMPMLEPVDLVLTDPPYGIIPIRNFGVGSPYKKSDMEWDVKITQHHIDTIIKISKNQIIFGGNYYTDLLKPTRCWIIWNKLNGDNPFADFEMAWTNFKTSSRMFNCQWIGGSIRETICHPTQKPAALFILILEKYSNIDDIICDLFLGSGTTAIACERLNRRWIGIEIEERYCEISAKRIEKERSQLKLF